MSVGPQLESIERRLEDLARRLERLEGRPGPASAPAPQAPPAAPQPRTPREPEAAPWPPPPREPVGLPSQARLEELFGGRVLAWIGSAALLLGTVLFLGMAISRGWIDEPTRTVLAFLGSAGLLAVGVWLYERKGRTEAALAAVASALSGLFATLIVATQTYELVAAEPGLLCAGLVGAVGVAIAVRWESTIVAAIGILGALLAPVLVGAGTSTLSLIFVAIALAAAVGVLLWQKWNWLSLGAFAVSVPQLAAWVTETYQDELVLTLAGLGLFWALYVAAGIGYELRARAPDALPVASWLLLLANVAVIAGAGYYALDQSGHPNGAVTWVLGLAAAHIALGAFALGQPISREIGSLLIAAGLGLSALGFADALDGPALVAGWAVQAVLLAYLATRASTRPGLYGSNAERLLAGAGGFLALAFGHSLAVEAPPSAIFEGVASLGDAVAALGASVAAALGCAFFVRRLEARWAPVAELAGAAGLVYLASVTIIDTIGVTATGEARQAGQVWLSAFWTATGLATIVYALLRDVRRFRLAGLGLLGLAVIKVYTYDLAELDELARVLSFIALGLLLLAGAFAYQRIHVGVGDDEAEESR